MSLGQIVRKKREQLNLTLDKVSQKIGYSKPYLSTIETGKVKNPPSDALLVKLEKVLEFESGLLLHIAHMEHLPCDIQQRYESAETENQKLRHFIRRLIEKKSDIPGLEKILQESDLDIESAQRVTSTQIVPIINKVPAGYPAEFTDLDYPVGVADGYIRCPDVDDPNAFAVRVVGDSMEPQFHESDIVVFSPAADVRNGDDCFVRFSVPHETTFKRVFFESDNKIRLQPRNDKYSPLIVEGDKINGLYRAIRKFQNL